MHRVTQYLVLAVALLCAAASSQAATPRKPVHHHKQTVRVHDPRTFRAIVRYRNATWKWQDSMGVSHTPFANTAAHSADARYRRWVLHLWRSRARQARARAQAVPHASAWLCIHHYEGAWNAATGNGYYGGLQMDASFVHHYAWRGLLRKGTPNRWTPLEQMWVAERALRAGRGFYPWPNTARACGLI